MLGRHLVKDARDLRFVEGADESQQRGVVQPREHLAGALRGEPSEERDLLVEGQTLEGRSDVRRVGCLERLIVAGVLAALEQALGRVEQPLLIVHDHRVRRVPSLAAADGRPSRRRGKLKVFFGAAAGVGKTYAMLEAAREQRADVVDVLIGYIETHGRAETDALLEGLEVLPPRSVEYRGTALREFDLDGALARRPALILVDELAHTNVPGSRH